MKRFTGTQVKEIIAAKGCWGSLSCDESLDATGRVTLTMEEKDCYMDVGLDIHEMIALRDFLDKVLDEAGA